MHQYDCYTGHPQIVLDATPLAERIATEVVSLPVHQHLSNEDVDRIVGATREAVHA
jgi:dTDP-4-amino-4,6-dideoxygalactose transaminase